MNNSSNNDPIELCEGLLDRYQQALQFRGIKNFHPCESHLWEPKNSLKLSTKVPKNVNNPNISSNNDPLELSEGLLHQYQQALQFIGITKFHPCESHMWEPKNSQKFSKNIKNLNISYKNGPIELGKGLLDWYQQALQFRGIKNVHQCESHLSEPKNSLKFMKKCQKHEYLIK